VRPLLLDEVAAYIAASSTFFAVGSSTSKTSIWKSQFPIERPNTAVALYETGGLPPSYRYDTVDHERPGVQVISRSTSYVTARQNAQRIWKLLATVENSTLSGVRYINITPSQSPFPIGSDAENRFLISSNFIAGKATT